jgi:GDP-4-dehydro-6-deoxy-D-mannose reductase
LKKVLGESSDLKILITGHCGFVGKHLMRYLADTGSHLFYGIDLQECRREINIEGLELIEKKADLSDKKAVDSIMNDFKPEQVYHLAARSSVSGSWKDPAGTFNSNVYGGINLLESIKQTLPGSSVLSVCTAEEYGTSGDGRPLREDDRIFPGNPYAVSKSALDFLSAIYNRAYGLNIMVARSFNHIGPGQRPGFVCSDFARQISLIEAGMQKPAILVGNLEASRDFLDVRDVVKAYWRIMNMGRPGEAYNVCSGKPVKISRILDILISLSSMDDIRIEVDRNSFRPVDIKTLFGDNSKLVSETGWKPEYEIEKTLEDTLAWWRKNINT